MKTSLYCRFLPAFICLLCTACSDSDSIQKPVFITPQKPEREIVQPSGGQATPTNSNDEDLEIFNELDGEQVVSEFLIASIEEAGHSRHGSSFNEGPRQRAWILEGQGNIHFALDSCSSEAQDFFNQGMAQVHMFATYEAERSFRQVNTIDPSCAMGYWGVALANLIFSSGDLTRAAGFSAVAFEVAKKKSSPREQDLIEALSLRFEKNLKSSARKRNFVRRLYELKEKYTGDIEIAALFVVFAWDLELIKELGLSESEIDLVLENIFSKNPLHPAHHYRIHLWDMNSRISSSGLDSAARLPETAPRIAHAWHMPMHIFRHRHRYLDSVYLAEAAVRVDHEALTRTDPQSGVKYQIPPFYIHNYLHHSHWLWISYCATGQIQKGIELLKNWRRIPQHPKYNSPKSDFHISTMAHFSMAFMLQFFGRWEEFLQIEKEGFWEGVEFPAAKFQYLMTKVHAAIFSGNETLANQTIDELSKLAEKDLLAGEQMNDLKKLKDSFSILGMIANSSTSFERDNLIKKIETTSTLPLFQLSRMVYAPDYQLELARKGLHELRTKFFYGFSWELVAEVNLLKTQHKNFPGLIALDSDSDLLRRASLADRKISYFEDLPFPTTENRSIDSGIRPPLQDLGELYWRPLTLSKWSAIDQNNQLKSAAEIGVGVKPTLLILSLDSCPLCREQVEIAVKFSAQFKKQGIKVLVVGSGESRGVKDFLSYHSPFEIELFADPDLKVFKAMAAFDDFENLPLHGIFLIDEKSQIIWSEISYQAFTDFEFLIHEAERLLKVDKRNGTSH